MIVILTIAPFSLNKNARVRLRRHCCRLYYHKMQQKLVNANAVREKGFVKEANPVLKTFIDFCPLNLTRSSITSILLQLSIPELRRNEIGLVKKKSWSLLKKKLFYEKIRKCTGVKSEAAVTAAAAATLVSRSYTSNYRLPWLPWV